MSSVSDGDATVILVEDDIALRSALAFMFEIDGFQVRAYGSAETALAGGAFPRNSCLVVDYILPRMDGLAFLREVEARHGYAPSILITSHPSPGLRTQAAEAGVAIVEKPLLRDELVESVNFLLASRRRPS
jgi:FixJ family two-component response regulator